MNTVDIIKSFQYFSEKILFKAFSAPDFNEEGIANAFLWAEFCEKLYGRLDEENLKKLKEHFGSQAEVHLAYENLKQCTTVLCHAFLQNPSIDKDTLKAVLSRIKPSDSSFSEILDDAIEFNQLCFNLIESLKPICFKESDRSLYHEMKSELFMDFLKDLASQLVTEGQAETLFNLLFETLCDNEDSVLVLLNILTRNDPQGSHIQALAIHWVLLKLLDNPECQLARFLWRQPPSQLRAVAAAHPAFFSCYVDFLSKCSSSASGASVNTAKFEVSFTHDEVLKHFEVLTSCHDDVGQSTLAHLGCLAQSDTDSAIWKEILSAIT